MKTKREDYIKCIRHTHAEKLKQTWCGRQVDVFEWAFMDINHAAYNALNGGRLVACPDCVKAIVAALSLAPAHACKTCKMIDEIDVQEDEQARFYSEMGRIGVRAF